MDNSLTFAFNCCRVSKTVWRRNKVIYLRIRVHGAYPNCCGWSVSGHFAMWVKQQRLKNGTCTRRFKALEHVYALKLHLHIRKESNGIGKNDEIRPNNWLPIGIWIMETGFLNYQPFCEKYIFNVHSKIFSKSFFMIEWFLQRKNQQLSRTFHHILRLSSKFRSDKCFRLNSFELLKYQQPIKKC